MPSVADFINSLAQKAGIKGDDEHLKNILSAPDLQKIMVPDELVSSIDNSLLSIDQAINNHPKIKPHYTAPVYNGIDTELNTLMTELGIPDDAKAVILNERSTNKRIGVFARQLKDLEAKKKSTDDKGEKASLQKEIDTLRGKLATQTDAEQKIRDEYEGKIKNIHKDSKIRQLLGKYKTVLDDLPAEARDTALQTLINKSLQDKQAELKLDENDNLVLVRKDGANVFGDDNRKWEPATLIDYAFTSNKVLKVNDPKPANPGNNPQPPVIQDTNPNNPQQPKKDAVLSRLVQASMKDQQDADKVPVQ
jgi:hypothetical protein